MVDDDAFCGSFAAFIALLKDSSLVSVITMLELTKVYGQLASTYYDYIGVGLITAEVEASLSEALLVRLKEVRATR